MRILCWSIPLRALWVSVALLLAACSPKFDWREIHDRTAGFSVMLPAKPATLSRAIDLNGIPITMTMTAAEVDGVTFAVGSAELPDPAKTQHALTAMKTALVNNLRGTVVHEKASPPQAMPSFIEIEAKSAPSTNQRDEARLLVARFLAKNKRIYQVVAVGKEKAVSREAVDTFISSFKLH